LLFLAVQYVFLAATEFAIEEKINVIVLRIVNNFMPNTKYIFM